jgi:large subunit ribosomal protein L3
MLGVIGTKVGMTRVFKDNGTSVPVTVISVAHSKIVQRKTAEKDGYYAVQVNYGSKKKVSKSLEKKFTDNGAEKGYLTEFNLSEEEFNYLVDAKEITLHPFNGTEKVDVAGVSKGKGFAGVVKRHNFKTQDATHGNSLAHRAPGSIGQCQFPGRVFKGKKMAGHMGDRNTTVQNLEIEKIDVDENVLLVKGAVPGSIGSFVKVTPSIKDGAKLSLEPIVEEASDTATETEEVVENIAEVATPEAPKEESQNTEAKETVDADAGTEDIKEETKEAEAAPADDTPKEETNVAEEENKTKKEDEKE